MLDNIFNSYVQEANNLENWQDIDKNKLADLYLTNRDTEMGSVYAAALICKYWYKIGLLWRKNNKAMTQEDCYWVVWDGIERAMKYAAWRNPENILYKDPVGPDKAINRCIESRRVEFYDFSNKDKRKLDHRANTDSLDNLEELRGDYSTGLVDNFDSVYSFTTYPYLKELVKQLIKDGNIKEAIIVDNICYNDSIVFGEKPVFSQRKLVTALHNNDKEMYAIQFNKEYKATIEKVKENLNHINNLSNFKLNKLIKKTIYLIKNNPKYFNYIA